MSAETVLVTGANSLLGTNVLKSLLHRNVQVKAMVRKKSRLLFSDPNMKVCLGDITDKKAVSKAVKGCGVVIHIAANTAQDAMDYEPFKKVNVTGTVNVFDAVNQHRARKMIFVGSANAFAYGTLQNLGDETKKIKPPFSNAFYPWSKYKAQQYIMTHIEDAKAEVVVVNPTFMLGKYDAKPSSGQIILRGYKKRFIFAPPGGKNFIHVKDAAEAICNAIEKGRHGQAYLLADENMSYRAFYKELIKVTGQKSRIITMPKFLLLFIGSIGNLLTNLGVATDAHYANMKILCVNNYYSNQKAKDELDLKNTSISKAINDAVDWFCENGMIKKK